MQQERMGIDEQGVVYFLKDGATEHELGHLACLLHEHAICPSGITTAVDRMWNDFLLRDVPIELINPRNKRKGGTKPPVPEDDAAHQPEAPPVFEVA